MNEELKVDAQPQAETDALNTEETPDAPAEAIQGEQSEATQITEKPKIKYKYNGQEYEADPDEVKPFVEAGRYYLEKGKIKLQEYENHPALKFIEKQAKRSGLTVDALIAAWEAEIEAREAEKLAEQLSATPEVAQEILKERRRAEEAMQKLQQYESEISKKKRMDEEIAQFRKEYQDVRIEDVPDEVLLEWDKGIPLSIAYAKYENKKLREEVLALKANLENKGTSMGTVKSEGATDDGEITQAEYDAHKYDMKWIDKHYDKLRPLIMSGKIIA